MKTVSTTREQIANRINARLAKLDMSQVQLAAAIGEGRSAVNAWCIARNKPSDEAMLLVAKTLETSISYLYGETDDPRPAADWHTESELPASATQEAIVETMADLQRAHARLAKLMDQRGAEANPAWPKLQPGDNVIDLRSRDAHGRKIPSAPLLRGQEAARTGKEIPE